MSELMFKPTVCMVYEQNRVDSKDTLIKTNFFARTTLLKRSYLNQRNRGLTVK
jgi:hypothetical protein